MNKIVEIAAKFTDGKKITNLKKKFYTELRSERHSMLAVAELKQVPDTSDPYLIYKVNDSAFNNQDDYVCKSSRRMANLAINMDQNASGNNSLKTEVCYFDGMHSRCKNWKTLTFWVYHPSSRHLVRLATPTIAASSGKFGMNYSVMSKVRYSFNPVGFTTDESWI